MQPALLLDTHVVIWLYKKRPFIGRNAMQLLSDKNQPLAVGYVSIMEMAIKNATGKLHYEDKLFDDLAQLGITIIIPDRITLREYHIFNPHNKDPFDNLLIAAAIEHGYRLLTADRKILATKAKGLRLLNATK